MATKIGSVARAYGGRLLEVLEGHLGQSLGRFSAQRLAAWVNVQTDEKIIDILGAMIGVHTEFADPLLGAVHVGASDEVVVIDSLHNPNADTLLRLFLYAEVVICADRLLEHPDAAALLAQPSPPIYPYTRDQRDELFVQGVEFFQAHASAIRSGLLLPTAWHADVALRRSANMSFVAPGLPPAWSSMSDGLRRIADEQFIVAAADFDGITTTIRRLTAGPPPSQIAILGKNDQKTVSASVETHLRVGQFNAAKRTANLIQGAPETRTDFERWVAESKLKTAYHRLLSLESDVAFSTLLNGMTMTLSPVNDAIMRELTSAAPSPNGAVGVAHMNLPALEDVSIEKLIRARRDDDALQNLRVAFRKGFGAIKSNIGDPSFQKEVDAITRDTVEQGLRDLRALYKTVRLRSSLDLALSTLAIAASFGLASFGQILWTPAVLGALNQVKSLNDAASKESEMKRNPHYMLWSVTRAPFRSGS